MAKKNNSILWVALIIIALIIILPKLNFNFSTTNNYEKDYSQDSDDSYSATVDCRLSLNPTIINSGESVTGIINGPKNTFCEVYASNGILRKLVYSGNTDENGFLSSTQSISLSGEFDFYAICGECSTNTVTLTVNSVSPSYTCVDSDGLDFMVAGNCQDSYHSLGFPDTCAGTWAVNEYYCDINNICQSQVMACPAPLMCMGGACVNIP